MLDTPLAGIFFENQASLGDMILLSATESVAGEKEGFHEGCPEVDAEELEVRLLQLEVDRPLIIDCSAKWCGPCQLMVPVMDEVRLLQSAAALPQT